MDRITEYPVVRVTAAKDAEEAVESALLALGSTGTSCDLLGKKNAGRVVIEGFFESTPDIESVSETIRNFLRSYNLPDDLVSEVHTDIVEDQDWLAEWKKHWKPTITGRFIIAPPWETVDQTDLQVIRIEPSMAFGTGTHETTRLCLLEIEEVFRSGMTLLDTGTGTGVLAIAAAKIAESDGSGIVACDVDEDSVKIARENAALNGVPGIVFLDGSAGDVDGKFDVVVANVTADIILMILEDLLDRTDRMLILSGILKEQEVLVASGLLEHGVTEWKTRIDGEWISMSVDLDQRAG